MPTQVATLGGGCFWCLEAVFERLRGVREVRSGYAGGHLPDPGYREVCTGATGHAEVVQVSFDPGAISYRDLLDVFFSIHDPTTPDRQGADRGPQYRSIVLWSEPEQRDVALEVIDELDRSGRFAAPIVTQVAPLDTFYPAESEHQGYYRANSSQPYCRIVVEPKLAALMRRHPDKLA